MKPVLIIFLLCFFSPFCFSQDVEQDVRSKKDTIDPATAMVLHGMTQCDSAKIHEKKNEKKIVKKFYSSALSDYKKAISLNKELFIAYLQLGILQSKQESFDDAIQNLNKAILIDTTHNDAYRERGKAESAVQRFSDAKKDFDIAISLNTNDYESFYNRGKLGEMSRDKQSAFEDYESALEIYPRYPDVLFRRGMLYTEYKKDYVLAIGDFNKVTDFDPDYTLAYLWKGKAFYAGTDYKSADRELSTFLKKDSTNVEALVLRGASRLNTNNFGGAVTDYDKVIEMDKKNFIALTNRGLAKGQMKNYDDGLADLNLAIKLKFDYSPAYINRALVKYMSKDRKGACEDLHKADGLNNAKAYELLEKYCKKEYK